MTLDYMETSEYMAGIDKALEERSEEYLATRTEYGEVKRDLFIHLIPKQQKDTFRRASVDKQLLMLAHETQTLDPDLYNKMTILIQKYITLRERYKGLEMICEVLQSRLTGKQSTMKWQRRND
jgi:hypothetical protein